MKDDTQGEWKAERVQAALTPNPSPASGRGEQGEPYDNEVDGTQGGNRDATERNVCPPGWPWTAHAGSHDEGPKYKCRMKDEKKVANDERRMDKRTQHDHTEIRYARRMESRESAGRPHPQPLSRKRARGARWTKVQPYDNEADGYSEARSMPASRRTSRMRKLTRSTWAV